MHEQLWSIIFRGNDRECQFKKFVGNAISVHTSTRRFVPHWSTVHDHTYKRGSALNSALSVWSCDTWITRFISVSTYLPPECSFRYKWIANDEEMRSDCSLWGVWLTGLYTSSKGVIVSWKWYRDKVSTFEFRTIISTVWHGIRRWDLACRKSTIQCGQQKQI